MASIESTATKTVLIRSEDWEKWFKQLQANISDEIWPFINPDVEDEELSLLKAPKRLESININKNTHIYT